MIAKIDREKVIKGLKKCSIDDVDCKHCPYNGEGTKKYGCETVMQRDALKLLKEQPEIVRCKDCKYRHSSDCIAEMEGDVNVSDDWFCADGERKTE